MIVIEKNKPVPPEKHHSKYPFRNMVVGDSVLIPPQQGSQPAVSAYAYGLRHNKKFTCRKEEGGVRIWRIE